MHPEKQLEPHFMLQGASQLGWKRKSSLGFSYSLIAEHYFSLSYPFHAGGVAASYLTLDSYAKEISGMRDYLIKCWSIIVLPHPYLTGFGLQDHQKSWTPLSFFFKLSQLLPLPLFFDLAQSGALIPASTPSSDRTSLKTLYLEGSKWHPKYCQDSRKVSAHLRSLSSLWKNSRTR